MDRRLAYHLGILIVGVLWAAAHNAPISTWPAAAIPYYLGVLGEVLRDLELLTPRQPARRPR